MEPGVPNPRLVVSATIATVFAAGGQKENAKFTRIPI
jgi:hypothetical protein